MHPTYTSTVDVNRTSTQWTQGFQIRRESPWVTIENAWNSGVQKNSAQNGFRRQDGSGRLRAETDLKGFGGWNGGVEMLLNRTLQKSDFDRVATRQSDANLFLTSDALGALGRLIFGLKEEELGWNVTGTSGVTSETAVNLRRTQKGSGLMASWDSTDAGGSTRGLESQLNLNRGQTLKVLATGKLANGRQDSESQAWKSGRAQGYEVLPKETNGNREKNISLNASWAPRPKTQVSVTGQTNSAYREFFSTQAQAQDITDRRDQRLVIDARAVPLWGVELAVKSENTRQALDYRQTTNQNQSARGANVLGTMKFTTGSVFGLPTKVEASSEVEWEKDHTSYGTSMPFDDRRMRLRQNLRRVLGKKVALLLTGEESLRQTFYPDGSGDRDEHRSILNGELGYRPGQGVETRLWAQVQRGEIANIDSLKSIGSSNLSSYRIEANLNYTLSNRVKIGQNYSVTADYNFYRFNENNNTLVRTTEVRTTLTSTVGVKARLELEHQYRFRDNGKYVRNTDGLRYYTKQAEENYQFLKLTTMYEFVPGFNLHAIQTMEAKRTIQALDRSVKKAIKVNFTGGLDLDHRFSPDFSVAVKANRTQSYTEPNYWRISASVNRVF